MLGMLSMLCPLLAGAAATFRRLSLQLLQLHKGVAKLGYIVTSLLSGVMQEGYCTASETEDTEAGMLPPGTAWSECQGTSFLVFGVPSVGIALACVECGSTALQEAGCCGTLYLGFISRI